LPRSTQSCICACESEHFRYRLPSPCLPSFLSPFLSPPLPFFSFSLLPFRNRLVHTCPQPRPPAPTAKRPLPANTTDCGRRAVCMLQFAPYCSGGSRLALAAATLTLTLTRTSLLPPFAPSPHLISSHPPHLTSSHLTSPSSLSSSSSSSSLNSTHFPLLFPIPSLPLPCTLTLARANTVDAATAADLVDQLDFLEGQMHSKQEQVCAMTSLHLSVMLVCVFMCLCLRMCIFICL